MNTNRGGSATPGTSTSNRFQLLSPEEFPMIRSPKRFCGPTEGISQKHNDGKFLIIANADPNQDLNKLCPFTIMKALEGYTTNLKNISKLRNGTLLVETRDAKQAAILYKADTLGPIKIHVKDHPTLNTTRGTIYSHDLLSLDEDYILHNLKEQNVIKVERIMRFNEAKELVPTPALILTFQGKTLPITVKAGFLSLRTQMYYPTPMKCKSCHKFGHTKKKCRSEPICAKCGKPQHGEECHEIKCINCHKHYPMFNNNPHSANDRNCIKYQEEKAVIKIMVDENKMYKEARVKFNQLYPKTATESTFAATVNREKRPQWNSNQQKRFKSTNSLNTPLQPHQSNSPPFTTTDNKASKIAVRGPLSPTPLREESSSSNQTQQSSTHQQINFTTTTDTSNYIMNKTQQSTMTSINNQHQHNNQQQDDNITDTLNNDEEFYGFDKQLEK